MDKQKVIVDTCFLEKVAVDGKSPKNIKILLDDLCYKPVVHQYVAEQEIGLKKYINDLVTSGYIQVVETATYLKDDMDWILYEEHYKAIYNELREYRKAEGGPKQMPELVIHKGKTIHSAHMAGSSMGDVHMVLMAVYLRLPIALSEDSDIELLRDIAKRRFAIADYSLKIYSALDLMKAVAENPESSISRSALKDFVRGIGAKDKWSVIREIWDKTRK